MSSHGGALMNLCECLRGSVPKRVDWLPLIGLANATLTTPALIGLVHRFPDRLPPDVRRYVQEIFERNRARNDRLAAQLHEAVAALNEGGVTPVLLKGAGTLAEDRPRSVTRMISDLDILVSPQEAETALARLFRRGYRIYFRTPPGASKWYAELQRPGDVGTIDLHQGPPGHPFFYRAAGEVKRHCRPIELRCGGRAAAYVPSATFEALILIVHDQFQDSDYWVGAIDLRHLLDLRDLVNAPGGIDWKLLQSFLPGKLGRNALETQLVTLFSLLAADVPAALRRRVVPRLQYRRRLMQTRFPALRSAFLAMALLDYWNYRAEVGTGGGGAKDRAPRRLGFPRMDTMRFLLGLAQKKRAGKV